MTEVILGQLRFILWMMCGGMAILAGYDVLRLFRWLVPHGAVWIAVEDLFFWG
ncbi:MAG TPA: spore cortex biosynthesis protein YabQ, partial [Lachnospiraceae bacterium]|nr:spore cortex biosynthesis protein YabQ [Lachnospiraceae bacterium]